MGYDTWPEVFGLLPSIYMEDIVVRGISTNIRILYSGSTAPYRS